MTRQTLNTWRKTKIFLKSAPAICLRGKKDSCQVFAPISRIFLDCPYRFSVVWGTPHPPTPPKNKNVPPKPVLVQVLVQVFGVRARRPIHLPHQPPPPPQKVPFKKHEPVQVFGAGFLKCRLRPHARKIVKNLYILSRLLPGNYIKNLYFLGLPPGYFSKTCAFSASPREIFQKFVLQKP